MLRKLLSFLGSLLLIMICLVAPSSPALAAEPAPSNCPNRAALTQNWGNKVVFDEFGYTGAPDALKWGMYNSPGHKGNGLRRPSQWSVNGSYASVTGLPNGTTGGMAMKGSGRVFGKYEICMRVPFRDSKYHPVALLWPSDPANYSARCWEIDFVEGLGDKTKVNFFNHYNCPSSVQTYKSKTLDMTQWHAYALKWTNTGVVGYIDGVEWFRDSNLSHTPGIKMFLALQLDWFPNGTATTTSRMDIDHVRIYQ